MRSIYAWIESPLEDRGAKVLKSLGCHVAIQPSPASHGTFPPNDSNISSGRKWRGGHAVSGTTRQAPLTSSPSSSPQFDKAYAYSIRHMFGKEGKRTDYTPYSCMKVILSNPPSQGDYHGEWNRHASPAFH